MCKYCKSLKELKDFDEKVYKQIISDWRRYCHDAEEIIQDLFVLLEYKGVNHGPAYERIHKRACDWLDCVWIGK